MSKLAGATARVVKGVGRIRPTATRAAITLTPEAVSRVQILLQQQHDAKALKIGVKQKGCNGLTYTLDYANEKAKFDEEVVQDGIIIWIDTKAQLSLLGTEMDYVSTKLSSEFVFRNPNIKGTCGCDMAPAEVQKKVVKKASKMKDPILTLGCLPNGDCLKTNDGEPLTLTTCWATHLTPEQEKWAFDLFERNMREMYSISQWGWDPEAKKAELSATTARFILVTNSKSEQIGYCHYRFDLDADRPVVYCYEIQVEDAYQQKGIGTVLINILEDLAEKTGMSMVMATVFAFNAKSLGFFHKLGYAADPTCPTEHSEVDYLILSKKI